MGQIGITATVAHWAQEHKSPLLAVGTPPPPPLSTTPTDRQNVSHHPQCTPPHTHTGQDQIERLLALGASRYEATADLLGRSVKLAMTPLLNTMSVVGLVSIPGVQLYEPRGGTLPTLNVTQAVCIAQLHTPKEARLESKPGCLSLFLVTCQTDGQLCCARCTVQA